MAVGTPSFRSRRWARPESLTALIASDTASGIPSRSYGNGDLLEVDDGLGKKNVLSASPRGGRRARVWLAGALLIASLALAACGGSDSGGSSSAEGGGTLVIGGIPDQDPDRLQRQFGLLTEYLSEELGVAVRYEPVAEYDAAVSAFRVGDLDLVWFGGLTGVQARLQVDGADAIAQRDIDPEFRSVFIATADSGIEPFDSVEGLAQLQGRSLTFGSDSSTSGRLMPQYYLDQAGVGLEALRGEPGFSGSHDATIELVQAGTFEVGALNSQVWDARVAAGEVDTSRVREVFRTPPYYDYHWVIHPDVEARFGAELRAGIVDALLALDPESERDAEILELFGGGSFISTDNENYAEIEQIGRQVGKITE